MGESFVVAVRVIFGRHRIPGSGNFSHNFLMAPFSCPTAPFLIPSLSQAEGTLQRVVRMAQETPCTRVRHLGWLLFQMRCSLSSFHMGPVTFRYAANRKENNGMQWTAASRDTLILASIRF